SLRLREEAGDAHGMAASLHNLGYVYGLAGALEEAAAAFRDCLALRRATGDRWYAAGASNNLGQVLLELGQTEEARALLESALAGGPCRLLLGEVLARRGQHDRARRELERARRAADQSGDRLTARAAAIELTALQLARGKPDDARALLDSRPVPQPGRLRPLE